MQMPLLSSIIRYSLFIVHYSFFTLKYITFENQH